MNKAELISAMAGKTSLTKKDTEITLNAFMEVIQEAVESGDKVQLIGFGTFEKRERAERQGRNPKTKELITIPAKSVPSFSASKQFKERVNK